MSKAIHPACFLQHHLLVMMKIITRKKKCSSMTPKVGKKKMIKCFLRDAMRMSVISTKVT